MKTTAWRRAVIGLAVWLAAAGAMAQERQEIRLPDLEGYVTLKCDLHLHTVFSDGHVWPTVRVSEAWRDGIDAIALTDHIEYQPRKVDIPTNHMRPYEVARGPGLDHGIIVIRGAEITKAVPPGHFNALFLTDINALAHDDVTACLEAARAQDAYVFWCHPGWRVPPGDPIVLPVHEELRAKGLVQGFEIFNGKTAYTNEWGWAVKHGLALIGSSDAHAPIDPPGPSHENRRALTIVFAAERTEKGVRDALFAGRAVAWFGAQMAGPEEWLAPLVRGCIVVDPPHHSTKGTAWVHMRNVSDASFSLRKTGGGGPDRIELPAGRSVRLRVSTKDGEAPLAYAVENAQTAPGRPLDLTWNPWGGR